MAQHRHKRETPARRIPRVVQVSAPLAVVATLSAVTMGVLAGAPEQDGPPLVAAPAEATFTNGTALADRGDVNVSRSQTRTAAKAEVKAEAKAEAGARAKAKAKAADRREKAVAKTTLRAVRQAEVTLWTTADLNLWDGPGEEATKIGLVNAAKKVLVTGRRDQGRAEIVLQGQPHWVSVDYLSQGKPELGPTLSGECSNGSVMDAGRASLYKIHDVVCSNWPQITSYGTWRGDGDHGQGRAVDIMITGETGWEVANFLRENYSELGIEYIIFSQHIWSVERGGEGWRAMSDRGSTTANHYDHVHVTVY